VDETGIKRTVHPVVKVLAISHMALILCWSLPNAAPAIARGNIPPSPANVASHFSDYLLAANAKVRDTPPVLFIGYSSGLWQYWDMFAPNPANVDYWFDTIVVYSSGRQEVFPYARMKDMNVWQKYFKERYRKYTERITNDSDAWKRPAFCQRIAYLAYKDPGDPPAKVFLRRHWREMPSMDAPVPTEYTVTTVFEYIVNQDKLMKDAAN
jgi:hypothetical protein